MMMFVNAFGTEAVGATSYSVVQVNGGGYNPRNPGMEANRNIQYTAAFPTPLAFYTGGEFNSDMKDDPLFESLKYLVVQQDLPQTISMSCGAYTYAIPPDLANSICTLFSYLGARGVGVLVASGNFGAGQGDCCRDTSGNIRFLPTCMLGDFYLAGQFVCAVRVSHPQHIPVGPHVTSVGRGGGKLLQWRVLRLLCVPGLPKQRLIHLPPEPGSPVLRCVDCYDQTISILT